MGEPSQRDLERRVLQALCQGPAQAAELESARRRLKTYHWREPLHETLFEILCELPLSPAVPLRQVLPARLTRRGFPDVNWEEFLAPASVTAAELEGLIDHLLT